jgi:hypothetical protein
LQIEEDPTAGWREDLFLFRSILILRAREDQPCDSNSAEAG